MSNFFQNVGQSTASSDIRDVLNTSINLKKMQEDAALKREGIAIEREKLNLDRRNVTSEIALRSEQVEAAKAANLKAKKEREYLDMDITDSIKTSKGLGTNFGPDGRDEFAQDFIKRYGVNGRITREQAQFGKAEFMKDDEQFTKWMDRGQKNWERQLNVAQEKEASLQERFDKDPSEENYAKLKEAKAVAAEALAGSRKFGVTSTQFTRKRDMLKSIEAVKDKKPELYKIYLSSPAVTNAIDNADPKAFASAIKEVDDNIAKITAARHEGQGMTDYQKAVRAEKEKTELRMIYDEQRKTIFGKYKLSSEQVQRLESGETVSNITGIRPEVAKKLESEIEAAKERYDDQYFSKFKMRPFGTLTAVEKKEIDRREYFAARKLVKDRATARAMDEEALKDGFIDQRGFNEAWGKQ